MAQGIFTESFFQDPSLISDPYYIKDKSINITNPPSRSDRFWQKILHPQSDLGQVHRHLFSCSESVNTYISEGTSDIYTAALKVQFLQMKKDADFNTKMNFFTQHLNILNGKFQSAVQHQNGCLFKLMLMIANCVRKLFGYPLYHPRPFQAFEVDHFIDNLKRFINFRAMRVKGGSGELGNVEEEFRCLFFKKKQEISVALAEDDRLAISLLPSGHINQYMVKAYSKSPSYQLAYFDEEQQRIIYHTLSDKEWICVPTNTSTWEILNPLPPKTGNSGFPDLSAKKLIEFELSN